MAEKKIELRNPFIDEEWEKSKDKNVDEDVTKIVIDVGKDGKEISKKVEHKIPRNRIFERYKDLPEISIEIAKELIGKNAYKDPDNDNNADNDADTISNLSYKDIRDKGLTFFMSTDTGLKQRTGLLSLCPALLTGIRLYEAIPESENKRELLSKLKAGIEACFKFIYRDQDWRNDSDVKPVFDASPYESDAFYPGDDKEGLNGRSYIDSISWATFLFLKILNFVDKNDKDKNNKGKKFIFEEYREMSKKLIKWCFSYVNNAVLTIDAEDEEVEEEEKMYQRPVGWSFSKIVSSPKTAEAQRSLYFTYAAASMYLALFSEYKDIIDNLMTLNRKNDDKEIPFSLESNYHVNNFKQAEDAIGAYENEMEKNKPEQVKALRDLKEALDVLKKADEDKLEDYLFFNDGKSAEYNGKIYTVAEINNKSLGLISQFKWNLEKISNDLWIKAKEKDKLENNFVYDDFSFNIATEEAIKSGGQTNALFAGLLQISICLYSTYDFVVSYTKDDGTRRFGPKAYEDMQNTMLLHVQKVQRFFDELEEEGKSFGVDSLTLRFPEDYSDEPNKNGNLTDRELAEKLRKLSIHITSLTPMLLKTNNLISRQVVKFPQKQMGASLIRIGIKRFYDKTNMSDNENKKYRWFWDSDGYHAMSNYYYVGAIFDFYEYYDIYERQYIDRYTEIRKTLEEDLKFNNSVREYYQKKDDEITELKAEYELELKEKDREIATIAAKAKKSEIGDSLVQNINQVVEDSVYFDKPEFLKRIIEDIRKQLAEELVERYDKNPHVDQAVLEQLKNPLKPKDGTLFSLLQALTADIILPSAIEANKKPGGLIEELGNDGVENPDGISVAKFALKGGKQLITDGVIDKLFALMFKYFNWKNPK